MAFYEDSPGTFDQDPALIAYRNAYRLKKKGLLAQLVVSLGPEPRDANTGASLENQTKSLRSTYAR